MKWNLEYEYYKILNYSVSSRSCESLAMSELQVSRLAFQIDLILYDYASIISYLERI